MTNNIHIDRAARLFNCAPQDVTPEMRQRAKEVYWMENYKASPETMRAWGQRPQRKPLPVWAQVLIVLILTTCSLVLICAVVYLITRGN